jgi:hypothetical protein
VVTADARAIPVGSSKAAANAPATQFTTATAMVCFLARACSAGREQSPDIARRRQLAGFFRIATQGSTHLWIR